MNDKAKKLVWQMVITMMAGHKERVWELYESYLKETRLYITVKEYIEWRKEKIAC